MNVLSGRERLAWTFALISVLCMVNGCTRKVDMTTLAGTYQLEHRVGSKSHGTETLVLKADGTYEQTFVPSRGGPTMTNTGTWDYDRGVVWLNDALSVPDPKLDIKQYPVVRQEGSSGLPLNDFGNFALCYDGDNGLWYKKSR